MSTASKPAAKTAAKAATPTQTAAPAKAPAVKTAPAKEKAKKKPSAAAPKPKVKPQAATTAESKDKAKKVKLVRDSFTMPKPEYEQIAALKLVLAKQGRSTKKSELLRAGLMLLGKQSPGALLASVEALTPIKTGRPKKD